jgi:hypothetical protein
MTSGHAAAAPSSSAMNSRRLMSDMGFSPTARRRATGEPGGDPRSRFAATLSLTRSDRHVLGADLNRSDSPPPHSPIRLPPRVQARARGHCVRVEKVALSLRGDHQLAQVDKNPARAAVKRAAEEECRHAYAGLLFKLAAAASSAVLMAAMTASSVAAPVRRAATNGVAAPAPAPCLRRCWRPRSR